MNCLIQLSKHGSFHSFVELKSRLSKAPKQSMNWSNPPLQLLHLELVRYKGLPYNVVAFLQLRMRVQWFKTEQMLRLRSNEGGLIVQMQPFWNRGAPPFSMQYGQVDCYLSGRNAVQRWFQFGVI
jgi:hypothetical protein